MDKEFVLEEGGGSGKAKVVWKATSDLSLALCLQGKRSYWLVDVYVNSKVKGVGRSISDFVKVNRNGIWASGFFVDELAQMLKRAYYVAGNGKMLDEQNQNNWHWANVPEVRFDIV